MSLPRYDRRVPQELVDALATRPMHELVELVLDQFGRANALDLQLRARPGASDAWATLYVGHTQVLGVYHGPRGFWLIGQREGAFGGRLDASLFDEAWERPQPREQLVESWGRVMDYVRAAIEAVPDRYKKEGVLQAQLARPRGDAEFAAIDRESIVSFPGESSRILEQERARVMAARDTLRETQPWVSEKKGFGDEVDLLAVDRQGRVLIVEAKDGADTTGLGLALAQVGLYRRLFARWVDVCSEAASILTGMLEQRRALGLAPDGAYSVADPVTPENLVPVIAIRPKVKNATVANERMVEVRNALEGQGVELPGLQIWLVHDDGAIERRPLGDL